MSTAMVNGGPAHEQPPSAGNLEISTTKLQRQGTLHLHHLRHRQEIDPNIVLSDDDAQQLLVRSLTVALTLVGFDGASPVALESFRSEVEEYLLHLISLVTEFMLSCRRASPIPQDFEAALARERIHVVDLLPHLHTPVPPSLAQPTLPRPPPTEPPAPSLSPVLGPILSGSSERVHRRFVPKNFPPFPSKHSYQFTADVPETDRDPRRVRERATEEGRLGEEALRGLMNGNKEDQAGEIGVTDGRRGVSQRRRLEDLWLETMEEVAKETSPLAETSDMMHGVDTNEPRLASTSPLELDQSSEPVNCERRYWRKRGKRSVKRSDQQQNRVEGAGMGGLETDGGEIGDGH